MKEKQDFQIFIISRFLVSLIYVVLSEFLIWFATDRLKHLFEGGVSLAIFIAGIIEECKTFARHMYRQRIFSNIMKDVR